MMKCTCGFADDTERRTNHTAPLAMAFVERQRWQDLYCDEKGLAHGTIFAELDLPFLAKGGKK